MATQWFVPDVFWPKHLFWVIRRLQSVSSSGSQCVEPTLLLIYPGVDLGWARLLDAGCCQAVVASAQHAGGYHIDTILCCSRSRLHLNAHLVVRLLCTTTSQAPSLL